MDRTELIKSIDQAVESLSDKLTEVAVILFGIPTQNPPGYNYRRYTDAVAAIMEEIGMEVERIEVPEERLPELAPQGVVEKGQEPSGIGAGGGEAAVALKEVDREMIVYPRINILGYLGDTKARPNVHFTGHYDVVPEGNPADWTYDPYGCDIVDGNIYARGSCDQKSGVVSELMAAYALQKAGIKLKGTLICSTTPDEESGGQAGVGYLVEQGVVTKDTTDYVIITECLDYDKICIGHRGTLWFDVHVKGKQCHGSQPKEGVSPIRFMNELLNAIQEDIEPLIQEPTPLPVMPPSSRWTTITPTVIRSGEKVNTVASDGVISFDWRLNPELTIAWAKEKITAACEKAKAAVPGIDYEIVYHGSDNPTLVEEEQKVVDVLKEGCRQYVGREAEMCLSPGMDDQKYIVQKGGLQSCVVYGPGRLTLAHKSDEFANIEEMKTSAKIMALAACDLLGVEE